ncbi:MAG: hypothetical protein WCF33_16425 [Pseudonocardiaceae bacterium]
MRSRARWAWGLWWLAGILAGMVLSFWRAVARARSALSIAAWAVGMAVFLAVTEVLEPSSWARARWVLARVVSAALSVVRAFVRVGLLMRVVSGPVSAP